jgi:ferredoxin
MGDRSITDAARKNLPATAAGFSITIEDTGEVVDCRPGEAVLKAVARLNRKGIPVGCFGGGCGVCKVQVSSGPYRLGKMSRAHVTVEEEAKGIALACKMFPEGDLRMSVVGKMKKVAFSQPPAESPPVARQTADG